MTDPTKWLFLAIFVVLVATLAIAAHINRTSDTDVYPDYHPQDYNDVTSDLDQWDGN